MPADRVGSASVSARADRSQIVSITGEGTVVDFFGARSES